MYSLGQALSTDIMVHIITSTLLTLMVWLGTMVFHKHTLFIVNLSFQVEESDHAKMAVANSFAIYGGSKCILVAARYVQSIVLLSCHFAIITSFIYSNLFYLAFNKTP